MTADSLESFALDLACWASRQIAETPVEHLRTKAHAADLVTDTDLAIETEVRRRLAADLPGHRIVGEEFGTAGPTDAEYTWYCDPIDGTTNYANRIAWCSFSLCCWDSTGPLIGVVADPFRRQVAVARRGAGARSVRLDDGYLPSEASPHTLAVRDGRGLAGTVLTTEWLAHLPWPGMTQTMAEMAAAGCTVRIMGSSALSLLQVGIGAAAGCIIGRYSPIDDSASVLIALEAGAVACGIDGAPSLAPDGGILLAAPGSRDAALAAWQAGVAAWEARTPAAD